MSEHNVDGESFFGAVLDIDLDSPKNDLGEGRKPEFEVVRVDGEDRKALAGIPTLTHGRTVYVRVGRWKMMSSARRLARAPTKRRLD